MTTLTFFLTLPPIIALILPPLIFASEYKVLDLESCIGDNKSILIENCRFIDGYLFNFRVNMIKEINFMMVRNP